MYQPESNNLHQIISSKWTESFKKLKLQHYSKRVGPLTEKKECELLPEKNQVPQEEEEEMKPVEEVMTTPDLSVNEGSTTPSIASFMLELKEEFLDGDADDEAEEQPVDDAVLTERPLPPLPTESIGLKRSTTTSKLASKGHDQLKRATTWLGLAGQKIKQATPQVQQLGQKITKKYQSSSSLHNFLRMATNGSSQNNFPVIDDEGSLSSFISSEDEDEEPIGLRIETEQLNAHANHINKKTLIAPKRIMHFQVKQIINSVSTRECEYELEILLNSEILSTKKGSLRKVDKSTSADTLNDEPLVFEIEEPFELDIVFSARHAGTSIRDGLAKLGLMSSLHKQEQKLPVVGHKKFCFEDKDSLRDLTSFKLINPDSRIFNMELVVDVQVEEILPALVEQFPWAFTTNVLSSVPQDDEGENTAFDMFELPLSREYCRGGDYLTIYTRGLAHPVWRRFWVTLEDEQLNLYDFSFKENKEALYTIPLVPLLTISKPSFDDYENVGISRKTGLMLYFNKNHAVLNEPVRLVEEEGLEGKLFLYADSEQSATHWRRTLGAYMSNGSRAVESEQRIDLRFLW